MHTNKHDHYQICSKLHYWCLLPLCHCDLNYVLFSGQFFFRLVSGTCLKKKVNYWSSGEYLRHFTDARVWSQTLVLACSHLLQLKPRSHHYIECTHFFLANALLVTVAEHLTDTPPQFSVLL